MFLFDTDHIVIVQRRTQPEYNQILARMKHYLASDFHFPIISFHEQFIGWHTYITRSPGLTGVTRGYEMFQLVLADFAKAQVSPFDPAAAAEFESLRRQRVRIGTMDLRIAATARAHRYTLLSRNLVDFKKVPGLLVEDWTANQAPVAP